VASGPFDRRSAIGALAGAALYFVLAWLSLSLSRFDTALATVWLPSACSVAFLIKAKLSNEAGFFAGAFSASVLANLVCGNAVDVAIVFSIANTINVALVAWLTRRECGLDPDMSELPGLARFLWIGGLAGPAASAAVAALLMAPLLPLRSRTGDANPWGEMLEGALNWYLTDSMSMIVIVPTLLLIADAIQRRRLPDSGSLREHAVLLAGSLACVTLVFSQNAYPLLFLILPMTLLHAFRHGSLGTALHVALVAVVASAMTFAGYGPIFETSPSSTVRLHLIQAFIAANFLTGLPIAAILAGRDRLTEALIEGRRERSLLVNSMTDAVLKLDADGLCAYASPAVEEVLGRAPDDLLGLALHDLACEDARQRMRDVIARLLSGESERERLTYRRRSDDADGVPVYIEADCAATFDPATGQREGVVVSARDVTERVELELLLTRARRHAESATNAKSDFLANMSHEIRTPMNAVLGYAELMLQLDLDPDQRRHTEMIVASGRSMMMLLNDILDLSKIEAGQIVIDKGPVDLHATLEECLALHRPGAARKSVALRLEREAGREDETDRTPTIVTDGLRLRQIVLNLIGNAVKFTETGEIVVSYRVGAGEMCVSVRDTGIGIGPSRLEMIFRPFTQGESDTARRFGGTGLGLSISRHLAQLLGGGIGVESVPGVGSTFSLTIPVMNAKPAVPRSDGPVPIRSHDLLPPDMPPGARILLVEDHDVNRMLVTEMLERCGQNVAIAQDGNEAISMVIDSMMRGRPFDLVLMDVQMPECDGYAATRAIRGEGIGADTLPIIALTANAFPEDVAAARAAGMQAHLAKPVIFADLARMLQRWLPTRIVEAPMDRDLAVSEETGSGAPPCEEGAETMLERWLERRNSTIEAVRRALEVALICADKKRRASDQEEREELLQQLHRLAGTAACFGEAKLGRQAAALEAAMRGRAPCEQCEDIAFGLLTLADEPERDASRG
jgi:PAS domain S-box-containing protein